MLPEKNDFKKVVVEAAKFGVSTSIDMRELGLAPGNLSISTWMNEQTRRIILQLEATIARGPEESFHHTVEISYPDGWWQAFKAEVLSRTRLTRWVARRLPPIRYKTETLAGHVKVVRMCPHLPIPQEGHRRHLEFLIPQQFEPYRW